MKRIGWFLGLWVFYSLVSFGQTNPNLEKPVDGLPPAKEYRYKIYLDDPSAINQGWLHIQPLVAELNGSNLSAGFGLQLNAFANDKWAVFGSFRTPFSKNYDAVRAAAENNASVVYNPNDRGPFEAFKIGNEFRAATTIEAGAAYHILSVESKQPGKVLIADQKKHHATEPIDLDVISVESKVRQMLGVRGGLYYQGSTQYLNTVQKDQSLTFKGNDGSFIRPDGKTVNSFNRVNPDERSFLYSSLDVVGGFIGLNWFRIRNTGLKVEKHGLVANNQIVNGYVDLMVSPSVRLADMEVIVPGRDRVVYDTDPVKLTKLGFRAGIQVSYNQAFYWSYGAEIGYRPGIEGLGRYALMKISFPALSWAKKVEAPSFDIGGGR